MTTDAQVTWRYVGIFLLGCILFSYPIMTLFNVKTMFFGFPLLFIYIFLAWIVLIVLIHLASRRHRRKSQDHMYFTERGD